MLGVITPGATERLGPDAPNAENVPGIMGTRPGTVVIAAGNAPPMEGTPGAPESMKAVAQDAGVGDPRPPVKGVIRPNAPKGVEKGVMIPVDEKPGVDHPENGGVVMAAGNAPPMEGTPGAPESMRAVGQDEGVVNPGAAVGVTAAIKAVGRKPGAVIPGAKLGVIKGDDTEPVGIMIAYTLETKPKTAIIAKQTIISFNNLILLSLFYSLKKDLDEPYKY